MKEDDFAIVESSFTLNGQYVVPCCVSLERSLRQLLRAASRSHDLATFEDALAAALAAGVAPDMLRMARNDEGHTLLGCLLQLSRRWSNKGDTWCSPMIAGSVRKLLQTEASLVVIALVAVDLEGTAPGNMAARAGEKGLSEVLYHAAVKAAARTSQQFRDLRSMLVVGNRVGLPRELVDHILEYCVTITTAFSAVIVEQRFFGRSAARTSPAAAPSAAHEAAPPAATKRNRADVSFVDSDGERWGLASDAETPDASDEDEE